MAVKFTEEQQSVIDSRKQNILVSAAAGSGKTAVLVQRIINMISEDVDIDHLLVVTFTKAAASQMREKISIAIQNKLLETPDDKHLQKQETLIHNAQITTIDSFCQYIVKNNFNYIGIDPSFRVGDDGELKIFMEDVMASMLEEEYEKAKDGGNEDFLFTMEYFGTGSSDENVADYINQLYKFAMSMPFPEDWIRERAGDYFIGDQEFEELSWVKECLSYAKRKINECMDKLKTADKICNEPDGPYMYGDAIDSDIDMVNALLSVEKFDDYFDRLRVLNFQDLSRKRDTSVNPEKRGYVKDLRDDVKTTLNKLAEGIFALPSETVVEQMKLCDRALKELCRLTLEYKKRFDAIKREHQLIDFSDMEHFALQILVDHPKEEECEGLSCEEILSKCTPSVVALEYRDYYKEVLIDEYQDSNNVQETILRSISGDIPDNSERFMVGDVKQSIYKFRLARPEIFMDKLVTYQKEPSSADRRIDLHMNFRSRKEVLEGTNYVFEKIMAKDLGSVDYDEDARLVPGATFDAPVLDPSVDVLMVDTTGSGSDELSEYDAKEREALVIAGKIKELRRLNPNLNYKDIVILLRSPSGWDDVFKKILGQQQIPAYVEPKSGYFEAYEVALLLDVLNIIDNPMQDIALVGVMKSCIGGFSDENLANIKISINADESIQRVEPLYTCLKKVSLDGELKEKRDCFVAFVEELRQMSTYISVHELLQTIIDRTGFDDYVMALPGGSQRKGNVDLLLTRALAFEKSSFKGLFHFVRYIEHMKNIVADYGEAGMVDENADVVRIMSIHKSKGLEFPVVFVASMNKQFNMKDASGDLIVDMDLGVGVKCIDSELRVKYDTLKRITIADKMKRDSLGEELRVLYVALTRAKEKLILTGGIKDVAKTVSSCLKNISLFAQNTLLPYTERVGAKSYYDLVLPALIRHPAMRPVLEKLELNVGEFDAYMDKSSNIPAFSFEVLSDEEILSLDIKQAVDAQIRQNELENNIGAYYDEGLAERLKERFSFEYPHKQLNGLFTKTTVSELKKHALEEQGEVFTKEDSFDKESIHNKPLYEGAGYLQGAERGTAYHRVMEILDDRIWNQERLGVEALRDWIKEKADAHTIPDTYYDAVYAKDILAFLSTDLGKRMGKAFARNELMREKPFMMGVSASFLDEKFPSDEMVLVQGIVDAWFIEDGEIVLMDYKTDKVSEDKELVDRYKIQLDLYKRALEAATQKKVKEVYIYSFTLGKQIKLY